MKKLTDQLTRTENGYTLTILRPYRAAYGFGEKFDSVNQKGKYVRACVREKCFRQGEYTYFSMPFFLTTDGFGVYVDTYVETDFDLRADGRVEIFFEEGTNGEIAEVYLFEGTPKQILSEFRSLVGMPRVFPKWALGAWMSANRWHTQAEIEEQRALAKKYRFPHNVVVVEPWSDLTTHYLWNGSVVPPKAGDEYATAAETQYNPPWENPKALVDGLHEDGLRLLLWIVPIYAQGDNLETKWNVAQCLSDNAYVKARKECVLNADGSPYEIPHTWCVGSMVPDFTDPVGKAHWFNRFRHLKEIGIDGFKTDGGEFIHDRSVKFHDGASGKEGQNRYCEDYASAFAEFIGEEGVVFSRSGGQRSPSFTLLWAGDQESTWEEFRSVLKAGLSAGFSGMSCWGFDIAGFSGYLPSEELYLRAVQTAAFVPIMQWHSDPVSNGRCDFSGAWKINDRSPWNIAAYYRNEGLLDVLRDQFNLHYNLLPYQYALMAESGRTGIPAMRHLALEFPEDERTYAIEDEFMLGGNLLVAPVTEGYLESRSVYLPAGVWYDLFTGERYESGDHEIALQTGRAIAFVRENTATPLNLKGGKLCSDVGNRLDGYEELTFLVSGAGSSAFEDDLGNHIEIEWTERSFQIKRNDRGVPVHSLRANGRKK